MNPSRALDVHVALTVQLRDMRLERYLNNLARQHLGDVHGDTTALLRNHLRFAETYHVGAAITKVLYGTAERYPDKLGESEFPPPSAFGVMVFDEPIQMVEHGGRTQLVHIVTWGTANVEDPNGKKHTTRMLTLWNDANRQPDEITREIQADANAPRDLQSATGGFYPIQLGLLRREMNLGSMWVKVSQSTRQRYLADGYQPAEYVVSMGRLIVACWDLMGQTRGNVAEPEHIERTSLRRARKQSLPARVQVVTLRRQAHGVEHPGTGTPLDHRVPVKEHHRHYWVRDPETGELRRERRKIAAHERGPKDAPLVVTDKVYSLRK